MKSLSILVPHSVDMDPSLDLCHLVEEDYLIHFDVICLLDFDSVPDLCFVVLAVEIGLVLDRSLFLCLCLDLDSIFCHDGCHLSTGRRDCLYRLEACLQASLGYNKEKLLLLSNFTYLLFIYVNMRVSGESR